MREPPGFDRLVVTALLLMLVVVDCTFAAAPFGTIQRADGDVILHLVSAPQNVRPAPGTEVQVGDVLETNADSTASVSLASGFEVSLPERSRLEFVPDCGDHSGPGVWLHGGVASLFGRVPQEAPCVRTQYLIAGVRGTEFVVTSDDGASEVRVIEGRVRVKTPSHLDRFVDLEPGEAARATADLAPFKVPSSSSAVQWSFYFPPIGDPSDYAEFARGASPEQAAAWAALMLRDAAPVAAPRGDTWRDAILRSLIARQRGDLAAAFNEIEGLPEPFAPSIRLYRAGLYLAIGRPDRAAADLDTAEAGLAMLPPDVAAPLQAGILAQRTVLALTTGVDPARVVNLAHSATAVAPRSASAILATSLAEQARGDLDAAYSAAERLVELAPGPLAFARLAELALAKGDSKRAEHLARQALRYDSNHGHGLTILGFVELIRGHAEAALETFEEAITANTATQLSIGLPHLGKGLALVRRGRLDDGRRAMETAVGLEPTVSLFRSYLGKAYFESNRSDIAMDLFRRAMELDPADPTPHLYQAFAKLEQNDPIGAVDDLRRSIEENDDRAVYRSRLLLDDDRAVRTAGLGRIFSRLGFDEVARTEAVRSLARVQGAYEAHALLARSNALAPQQRPSVVSEDLLATLLSPTSLNALERGTEFDLLRESTAIVENMVDRSPALEPALNEYGSLLEQDGMRTLFRGGGEHVASGKWSADGLLHSLGVSDGTGVRLGFVPEFSGVDGDKGTKSAAVRPRGNGGSKPTTGDEEDDRIDEYGGRFFAQHELTPEHTVSLEADRDWSFDLGRDSNLLRAGYHGRPWPGAQIVTQYARLTGSSNVQGCEPGKKNACSNWSILDRVDTMGVRDTRWLSVVLGGSLASQNADQRREHVSSDGRRAYLNITWHGGRWADLATGFQYADYRDRTTDAHIRGTLLRRERLGPELGLAIYPTGSTTVRIGYADVLTRRVGGDALELGPTQVVGFDLAPFLVAETGDTITKGIGLDQRLGWQTYVGAGATRKSTATEARASSNHTMETIQTQDVLQAYWSQIVSRRVAFTARYVRGWQYKETSETPDTDFEQTGIEVRGFGPAGLFGSVGAAYRSVLAGAADPDHWIVDGSLGVRLPSRRGYLLVGVTNALDAPTAPLNGFDQVRASRTAYLRFDVTY